MNKSIICLLASVILGASAGCQSQSTTSPKKTGSYTAARRNSVSSHIPQPYSADTNDATFDPDAWSQDRNQASTFGSKRNSGGVGGQ